LPDLSHRYVFDFSRKTLIIEQFVSRKSVKLWEMKDKLNSSLFVQTH